MKTYLNRGLATLLALGTVITSLPAEAQQHGNNGNGRSGQAEWNRDHERETNQRRNQAAARQDRRERVRDNRQARRQARRLQYYGSNYGYQGYQGRWRSGQRFPNYRNSRYYVNDYAAYGLPAPQRGYRYYRADNGDIVMAAVASGIIGLIVGGALAR